VPFKGALFAAFFKDASSEGECMCQSTQQKATNPIYEYILSWTTEKVSETDRDCSIKGGSRQDNDSIINVNGSFASFN
jgi:hypothetical protein